jgi:putative ABC transport system permease protein
LGTAALFLGLSLREAVNRDLNMLVGRLGADVLRVISPRDLTDDEIAELKGIPGVEAVGCQGPTREFNLPDNEYSITWFQVSANYLDVLRLELARGRDFLPEDGTVAILGSDVAEVMFGDADPIGQDVEGAEVVGVLAPVSGDDVLRERYNRLVLTTHVPAPSVVPGFLRETGFRFFFVRASKPPKDEAALVQAEFPDVTVSSVADFYRYTLSSAEALNRVVLAASAGLLAIAAVLVAALLSVSALQRTREIGIRRAVGATPAAILSMLLSEASLIGLLGGGAGLVIGAVVTAALGASAAFSPLHSAVLPGVVVIVLAASLFPALGALRVAPVAALAQRTLYGGSARRPLTIRAAVTLAIALATLGIVLVANTFVASRSFVDSMWGSIDERTLAVAPPRQSIRLTPDLTTGDRRLFKAISDVELVVPYQQQTLEVGLSVAAVDSGFPALRLFEIVEGRDLEAADFASGAAVCIVSAGFATERGLSVASDTAVEIGRTSLRVVGVFSQGISGGLGILANVVVPMAFSRLAPVGSVGFLVRVRRGADLAATQAAIVDAFALAYPDRAHVNTASLTSAEASIVGFFAAAMARLGFLGAIALFLAIGEASALVRFLLVLRTQEIGLRRAVGAAPWGIWAISTREAAASVVPGVVAGTAAGHFLTPSFFRWFYGLVPPSGAFAAIVALVCVVVISAFGAAPARALVRAQPADLLVQERE